ncbi:MAG: geranylgeranylglycerol-phosphate geranylgeranyltransferase [Candidatus Poribacteria bacterium]|nr:geranylgeranylglycerol-phosphate geranylgeranyltransferase [Candidatus Poribacteria bacterium]
MIGKIRAYVDLARPLNGLIAVLGVVVGADLGVRTRGGWVVDDARHAALMAVSTLLVLSAGNAFNDTKDVEIDRVNRPERPLPSGRLSVVEAIWFGGSTMWLGVTVALFVNWLAVGIALVASVALVGYAIRWKAVPLFGNLMVGALSAAAFFVGGIAVDGPSRAIVPSVFVFLFTVVREIVKDMEDVEGDLLTARTLPVMLGMKRALGIAAAFTIVGIAATLAPYFFKWDGFGFRYFLIVLLGVDLLVVAVLWQLWRQPDARTARRGQRWIKIGMIFGLIAVYVG